MDWVALYHAATVTLGMTEAQFWRCTLRKLCALHRYHMEIQRPREREGALAALLS